MRAQRRSNTLLPREKMLAMGPSALTEPELLALLLRTGCQGMNVMELASHLLEQFGGLEKLLTTQHQHLMSVKGLGPAKATQLSATLELCRRVLREKVAKSELPALNPLGSICSYTFRVFSESSLPVFSWIPGTVLLLLKRYSREP